MMRKFIALVQTLTLVASLAMSFFPAQSYITQAADIAPPVVADAPQSEIEYYGVENPAEVNAEALDPVDNPSAPQTVEEPITPLTIEAVPSGQSTTNAECGLSYTVILYRDTDPATLIVPSQFPSTRILGQLNGEGWDYITQLPNTFFPRPNGPDTPPSTPNPWNGFPTSRPSARFWQYTTTTPQADFREIRLDDTGNFVAARGQTVHAIVLLRNQTAYFDCQSVPAFKSAVDAPGDAVNAPAVAVPEGQPGTSVPLGLGQNLIFNSIDLQIKDADGPILNTTLTPLNFVNMYNGTLLANNNNRIGRGVKSPNLRVTDNEDYVAIIPFTVPFDAVDYIEAIVSGAQFQCTTNACASSITTRPFTDYYVVPIGGLWLYQTGDVNPLGTTPTYNPYNNFNPFQLLHLVGGPGNRKVGDTVWMVAEVRNKWTNVEANGADTASVKTLNYKSGASLPACDGATGTGDPLEGWYSSVIIDPVSGPLLGSTKLPGSGPGSATDMGLGGGEVVYCVFKVTLGSGSGGIYTFTSVLEAQSYTTAVEVNPSTSDLVLTASVPVAGAAIQVEKTVIAPVSGTPPQPDLVRAGDEVTYEIVVRNVGEVPLDNVRIIDNLIGVHTFAPDFVLDAPTSLDPYACPGTCTATAQLTYTVRANDPNPIFNTAVGYAEIQNTNIQLSAVDSASILQAEGEFQVILSARGNINEIPVLGPGGDDYIIYSMKYFNNTVDQIDFSKIEFQQIQGQPVGTFYPLLQNPLGQTGSIDQFLPNNLGNAGYPEIAVYSDTPPTPTSLLIRPRPDNLFQAGVDYPELIWFYDIPDFPPVGQPADIFPLVQQVKLKATRIDGVELFATDTLITEVENPNIDIQAQLWDPLLQAPRDADTVLRSETLTFNLNVNINDPNPRCQVFVRQYVLDPQTGVETLVNPDIQLNWTTPNQTTLASYSTNIPALRPQYKVDDTSPDPLIVIFEIDARKGCTPANDHDYLIDRVVLQYDVSNVNITPEIIILTGEPNSTTEVTAALYPREDLSADPQYQILYRATNNGPLNPDIIDWKYCIVDSPVQDENCATSPNGGISMFDGRENGYPDFDVENGAVFGDISRKFTTFPPRDDRRIFSLRRGEGYPNPLIIQVILEVSDTGFPDDATIVRAVKILPLIFDDLNFEMSAGGRTTIVRGDHDYPIDFTFENTGSLPLSNVQVLDLQAFEAGGGFVPVVAQVDPPGPYKRCEMNLPDTTVTTVWPLLLPGESVSGRCYFDFTDDIEVPEEGFAFRASVIATEDGGREVFDQRSLALSVVPHLEVEKTTNGSALASSDLDYEVTVYNNSEFQYVDFNNITGVSDIFDPIPTNSQLCIVQGNPALTAVQLCPNVFAALQMSFLDGLVQQSPTIYRLPRSPSQENRSAATISYRLVPNGSHAEEEYLNVITFQGNREYNPIDNQNETLVSGNAKAEVSLECPIIWSIDTEPAGTPELGQDVIYSLGEEVVVTIQAINFGGDDVEFLQLYDPRFAQDFDPAVSNVTFIDHPRVIWPHDLNAAIPDHTLPAYDPEDPSTLIPLTYTFNMRVTTEDFLDFRPGDFASYLRNWIIQFETDTVQIGGCSFSGRGLTDEEMLDRYVTDRPDKDEHVIVGVFIWSPLQMVKRADPNITTLPLMVQGQPVKYYIEVWNFSETTDVYLEEAHESRFDDTVIVEYCPTRPVVSGNQGICTSGLATGPQGTYWKDENYPGPFDRYRVIALENKIPSTDPVNGGLPLYYLDFDDASASPLGRVLSNQVTYYFHALDGPSWVTGETMGVYYTLDLSVIRPLEIQEVVLDPPTKVLQPPDTIVYQVTVTNTALLYTVENISLSNIFGAEFVYPICGVTPGAPATFDPEDPLLCLEQMPFTLAPGESVSVNINLPIGLNYTEPTVETRTLGTGTVVLPTGSLVIDPPMQSDLNIVKLDESTLTLQHQFFADSACTQPFINVTSPDRDKDDDGIPEIEVGGSLFYRLDIFIKGPRIYSSPEVTIEIVDTGITSLSTAINQRLREIAESGENPAMSISPADESLVIQGLTNEDNLIVSLCMVQPNGYIITTREPDILVFNAQITASDTELGEIAFATTDEQITDEERGTMVEKNLLLNTSDPFIFISKRSEPDQAFPGQVVTYTISIENLSQGDIRVNDMWDSNIGVGQQFDVNGDPLQYQVDGLSSIPFDKLQSQPPLGVGWDWTTPGLIPAGSTITYKYQRTITEFDPNPIINRAGVIGYIDNDPPNGDVPVQDETINSLVVSNSQLNVIKTASPRTTTLGNNISYEILVTNIGENRVYDVILWDDRFNLEHASDGYNALLPNSPPKQGVIVAGGEKFIVAGTNSDAIDLAGTQDPINLSRSVSIFYNLPVPPECVGWTGLPNLPFDATTQSATPTNVNNNCEKYVSLSQLAFVDPFINNAFATGLVEDGFGGFTYLNNIGFDRAVVDIINTTGVQITKQAAQKSAPIGSDLEYRIRIINTASNPLVINEVLDKPDSATVIPIKELIFEDCPVSPSGNTEGLSNLSGTKLLPFIENGSVNSLRNLAPIQINATAILPAGCAAGVTISITIPNPLPDNEYINIAEVKATNTTSGAVARDLTYASINITASGLEVNKQSWNCNTAANGANTPDNVILPDGTICTVQTTSGGREPGAIRLTQANEGQEVFFEIALTNSGSNPLTSLQLVDKMLINQGLGLEPYATRVANGTTWTDGNGEIYTWLNGQLILGVENYKGVGAGTCSAPQPSSDEVDDPTYQCLTSYRGYNRGPFGEDDPDTDDRDESYLFDPREAFQRPDPGPVAIPMITYRYLVTSEDDLDSDENYVNRVNVMGTTYDPASAGLLPIANSDTNTLQIIPAEMQVTVETCAETDGNPATFDNVPCTGVVAPGGDVWYRITLTNLAFTELENIRIFDTLSTNATPREISNTDPCWTWETVPGVLSANGDKAVCLFRRDSVVPALPPLSISNDPYITRFEINYDIDTGTQVVPADTIVREVSIRVSDSDMLLSIVDCEDTVFYPGGTQLSFNVQVTNLSSLLELQDIQIQRGTTLLTPAFSLAAGASQTLNGILDVTVDPLGDLTVVPITATATLGSTPPQTIFANTTCEIQRAESDLLVTKTVFNPATGGTTARPGDIVTYSITIRNRNQTIPITNLDVSDLLLENSPLSSGNWTWPVSLNPNQSITKTFFYEVSGGVDPLINTASATGTLGSVEINGSDTARLDIATGDLIARVLAEPNPALVGDTIIFRYEICNISPANDPESYNITTLEDNDLSGTPLLEFFTDQPYVPNTLTLNAQQCAYYKREVPTTIDDGGTVVSRAVAVVGCQVGENCPPTPTVADSQVGDVPVNFIPSPTAGVDIRLTADKVGLATGDTVNYTLRITNLNTVYNAVVTVPPDSIPDNIFIPKTYVLGPYQSISQFVPYVFQGSPDPLVASVDVTYVINGITTVKTVSLSLPTTAFANARLLLSARTLETESTPGGYITYEYKVINISNDPIDHAYLYDPYFLPVVTPGGDAPVSNCRANSSRELWGLGNAVSRPTINNFVPTVYPNGFVRVAQVRCQVAASFKFDPPGNLIHSVKLNWEGAGPTPSLAQQDLVVLETPIVAPLAISMTATPSSPGGAVLFQFIVENIGTAEIQNVSLVIPDLPDECQETEWVNRRTLNEDGSPANGSLWNAGGTTIAAGAKLIGTAQCTLREDILAPGQQNSTFVYPSPPEGEVGVAIADVVVDRADPITISVVDLVRFSFIPPSNNPTLNFIRVGDVVQLGFLLTNSPANTGSIQGLQYQISIGGDTQACENVMALLKDGSQFTGTLANPGDTVLIICTFRPDYDLAGEVLDIVFTATHLLNGQPVPVPVPNPLASSFVENLGLQLSLTDSAGRTAAQFDDGEFLEFVLTVTNSGDSPLSNLSFSQSMLDLVKGSSLTDKGDVLGDLSALYLLVCPDPLLPGDSCEMTFDDNPDDLSYAILTSDPQKFAMKVIAEATSTSGSNMTATASTQWTGTVTRPIIEIGGGTASVNSLSEGNVWIVKTENLSITPNPVELGGTVTFNVTIANTGYKTLSGLVLKGTINQGSNTYDPTFNLTSNLQQSATATPTAIPVTFPVTLTFTLGSTTLAPGESTVATATWTAAGVTPPVDLTLRTNFSANVQGGNYPAYNVDIAPATFRVAAVSASTAAQATTGTPTAGGDPNATEPIIEKVASVSSAFPGENVLWTITVTNQHTQEMASVTISDAVPGDLTVLDVSTTLGASVVDGNLVSVTTGALAPGEQAIITIGTTISLDAEVPGIITNTACGTREGGTEVCASADVSLGPDGLLPDTGIRSDSNQSGLLKFMMLLTSLAVGFLFLSLNMTNRQRYIILGLALLVIAMLAGSLLLLGGGDDSPAAQRDGDAPDEIEFPTATPLPEEQEVAQVASPTLEPTVAPDALATIQAFPATATPYIPPTPSGPRRLDVPALNYSIPLPIVELPQYNGEWDVTNLGHNIGWLDNTTWLDPTWGNTVLVGHIQLSDTDPGPFYNLDRLAPGDEILVMEGSNVTKFLVEEIFTVKPTDNSVTHPDTSPMLTLITCTNWEDDRGIFSDRLVIRARPAQTDVASGS